MIVVRVATRFAMTKNLVLELYLGSTDFSRSQSMSWLATDDEPEEVALALRQIGSTSKTLNGAFWTILIGMLNYQLSHRRTAN
jgi:hypothetical protein